MLKIEEVQFILKDSLKPDVPFAMPFSPKSSSSQAQNQFQFIQNFFLGQGSDDKVIGEEEVSNIEEEKD